MNPEVIAEVELSAKYITRSDNPCKIVKSAYVEDKSTAIQILSKNNEPLSTATVWLHEQPAEGCVWIKNWSENEGVLESLTEAKIIEPTGRTCPTGWVEAHEAKLLV